MKPPIYLSMLVLVSAGCANNKTVPVVPQVNRYPVGTINNVRFGEVVKAYPVERYRDPSDPRIMHEKHVAYRVEAAPAWKLNANPNEQVIVGNTVTDLRTTRKPMLTQEVTAEVLRSQRQNQAVLQSQATIAQAVQGTHTIVRSSKELQEFTLKKVAALEAKVAKLEQEKIELEKRHAAEQEKQQTQSQRSAEEQPAFPEVEPKENAF
jgi:hypothetical protein